MSDKNETKQPSLLAAYKIITVEWFLSSTAHAIPNIFRTSNVILKLIWLCCFLASGIYCIISMVKSLNDFLTYPTYLSTLIVQEIPAIFPALTICSLKTVNKTTLKNYFTDEEFKGLFLSPFSNVFTCPVDYIYAQKYSIQTKVNVDFNESSKFNVGYQLKDMLVSCMFNYKPCSLSDFTPFYDPLYGNCYTFNKGVADENGTVTSLKKLSLAGPYYGLVIELFLGEPNRETVFDYNDGLFLSVHNQSSTPFADDNKIMLAAGADTDVVVSRSFLSKLDQPYGACLKDLSQESKFSSPIFSYIVRTLGVSYSQKYCFSLCVQREVNFKCNCSITFLPVFKQRTDYCRLLPEILCMIDIVNAFGESQASEVCKSECPFECDTIEYETQTFRSYYPTEFYKTILANHSLIKNSNISYADINKAVAKVNVYYKSMIYKSIEEKAQMSTETFFSNIGGTLGLYLGISILSIVEVLDLAFNLILAFLTHKEVNKEN